MRPDHRGLEAPAGEATAVDTAGSWQESIAVSLVLGRCLRRGGFTLDNYRSHGQTGEARPLPLAYSSYPLNGRERLVTTKST